MGSHGIKDRVAIVGMGCTNFVEHWDKGLDDLTIEAADDAYASAGIAKDDVDEHEVAIGMRIEMTFRRLFTADGIANYFWKGRLVRDG